LSAPLVMVVAIADGGVIGKDGKLPWHVPEDLRHFKRVTMGHTVIVGRKTFESIGKVLPGRRFVILSRQPGFSVEGAEVARSIEEALAVARRTDEEPRVIGGAAIYEAMLPFVTKVYLTEIHRKVEGDDRFDFDRSAFREVERRKGETEDVEFVTLVR
jgi:dihydrofolate reductase